MPKFVGNDDVSTVLKVCKWLKKSENRHYFNEVEELLNLIMMLPATNAVSERSFSTLKRIKTYLRSTIGQERLNACLILNSYKELTDSLDVNNIIKEFVSGHTYRKERIAVI